MKIAIVGVGRLGSVFAKALSENHELVLLDRDLVHAKEVANETGAKAEEDLEKALESDMVIVSVKPAHVEEVVRQVGNAQLLVSCAAGVPIRKLESWGGKTIIRIMPNICAQCNEAVIAYSLHPEAEKMEKRFLSAFSSLGLCLKTDESHLDPLTGASGSGPAFMAFFAEAMIEEAIRQGLDRELAEKAVAQTLVGTGKLMLSGWSTQKITETVASPGGTTEAGLKMLEGKSVHKAIHEAMHFAIAKARELGK
jgi:pyrroline-5-carboxylate reductase